MEHQVFLSCKHIICFMKLYIEGEQSCYISGISNYILQLSITNITSSSSRFLTILPCQVDMDKAQASLYFLLQYQRPDGCFLPAGCRSRSQPERNLQTRPQKKIQQIFLIRYICFTDISRQEISDCNAMRHAKFIRDRIA